MKTSSTPTGEDAANEATSTDTGEEREKFVNPRHEAMERIARERDEKLIAEGFELDLDEDFRDSDESGREPEKVIIPAQPAKKPAKVEDADQKFTVKIDGEERLVSLSELQKGYQLEQTAQKRLQVVAQKERELEERLKASEKNPIVDGDISQHDDDDSITRALQILADGGDVTEAAKLLKQSIRVPSTPDVKAEVKKVIAEDESNKVYNTFLSDYDELKDPAIYKMCDFLFESEFLPKIQSGELTYDQGLRAAGNATRGKLGIKTTGRNDLAERREAKKNLDNIPRTANRSPSTVTDEPATTSDTIAEMKRARGQ